MSCDGTHTIFVTLNFNSSNEFTYYYDTKTMLPKIRMKKKHTP